uniref:Alpha-tectorin-like n=1 Tax=Haplochromis burtoni TaxID=8153 RepID=A0A3Q2VYC1_HAPBU
MLRPLLCLCALIALTGAQWSYQQTFNESSVVNISSCPITYYGQQYEKLYVNITSGNVTACFNGFFSPETGGDCVVEHSRGAQQFGFFINLQPSTADVDYVRQNFPTIQNRLERYFLIQFPHVSVFLYHIMYRPGTVISSDPQTCFSLTCNETAVLNTSSCGALERCQGNGICTLDTMLASTCTVTGPTIIDVHGQINSIQDRCAYSLFSTPSLPDFLVLGNFRDRRRKDVSFLDSVTLRVDGHYIHLEQGGRVQVSDLQPQFMCQSGGLCGNSSSSLSDLRLSEYSSTSCNLLKEAPFSSCNTDIDPEPYITACTDTLCKYPAVDGLNCQFLKAYARACSLHNHALDGWTSKTGCSSEAFCQDRTCSDHEFCGEKTVGGDTRCFCRDIFASKYQANNSLGDPTVCMQDSASVTLVGCLLEDKGINYSALHLNDPTCRGQVDELTHMVTFSFNSSNSCGTVVTTNNSELIYKNTIMTQNSSSDIINGHDQVYIDFSCVQTQADIKTATFRIRDSSMIQHITSGVWDYTLTMCATTDVGHTQAVESSTEVQLIQKIRVELKTDGLDGDVVVVVTDSCWATDQPSTNSTPRYDLIINGCANPADQTVQVKENGLGTSNYFSFSMFQFTGSSGEVYLHCELHLCPKQNNCVPTCPAGARRRRSARSKYEGEAFISMAWTH